MKDVPVAACATIDYLLVGNEGLFFGSSMKRSLLNPNQLRMNGTRVINDPTVKSGFGIHTDQLYIPFRTHGTTVYFTSQAPSQKEIEDMQLQHIVLTSDKCWDPQTIQMRPQGSNELLVELDDEFAVRNVSLLATSDRPIEKQELISDSGMEHLTSVSPCLVPNELDRRMVAAVHTTEKNILYAESAVAATMTDKRHSEITPTEVAKKFNIGLETAQRTLTMTTQ